MNLDRDRMLKDIIRNNTLGALIFWRPDELVITCGYLPLWGLSFLVYPENDKPVLFVPELEPEDSLPKGLEVRRFPWGQMGCPDPWGTLAGMIRALLVERDLHTSPVSFIKSIGGTAPCIMSGEQPPLPADLIDKLSSVTAFGFKDSTNDILQLYAYKTESDIQRLRLTHKVTAIAVRTFYDNLKPGITEAELAGLIEYEVQRTIGRDGIHFAKAWPMILSGPNATMGGKYNRSTGKNLKTGEMVMLEMAVCVNGYWADISRTGQTGAISEQHQQIFRIVLEAQAKAISMMKPGVPMADVDDTARRHIKNAGFGALFNHALGHHVGFRYHDAGAALAPGSAGVLEEGMVLTVEPGIYGEEIGCGVRIEDNVLITKDGNEVLSDYPRLLAI